MIFKCNKADEECILSYIGSDYPSCLYMYLDMLKYGIDSNAIDVYMQTEENETKAVFLKYYTCLHIYSRDNSFDVHEFATFFAEIEFTMLYCTAATANRVYSAFPQCLQSKATITEGWVAQIRNIDHAPQGLVTTAEKDDFEQIARLIFDDEDIGRSYKYDELAKQIEERNQQGYARNLIIKQDGIVIAHACTNAEQIGIAVVAELLVRKEYRRKGFAAEIWREICSQLLSEGKEVYSFYFSEESRALHKKVGFFEVRKWAKIVIA